MTKDVFIESPDGSDTAALIFYYYVRLIPGKQSLENSPPGYPDEYLAELKRIHFVGLRPSWLTNDMLIRVKNKHKDFTFKELNMSNIVTDGV